VDNVEIRGEGAHKFPKTLNEGERIGIGIAVGLVVVFTLTAIYMFMYYKGKSNKTMKLEVPRNGKARRDSLTSKGTEDISLDDAVEGPSGLTAMNRGEPRRTDAPMPNEDEEEEEELNIFVAKF
ncbi:uncharacterized protein LOC116292543, partial [Actinia tenebrosa]|uniref:Uncharacterized protein LOC116292543 n=1 Tax=Actinia tenebrosa TaxID=6105 RepID=A0A6P8HSX8_ACTTE